MTKVISVAAMISALATASFAGNLNTVETQEVDNVFVAAPSSAGLGVPLAVLGGVAALALIASSNDDDAVATATEDAD